MSESKEKLTKGPKGKRKTRTYKKKNTKSKDKKTIQIDKDVSASEYEGEYNDIRWLLPDGSPFIPDTSGLSLEDYNKMTKDYQIAACINVISFTIQQIDWDIKCENEKMREFLYYAFSKIWNQLVRASSQSYWAGFSPMIKIFSEVKYGPHKGKIYIKRFKDLLPTSVKVIQDKSDGSFKGMKYNNKTIQPEYCFWYTFLMKNSNYYGTYLLEAAYMPYYYSQVVHLFANRYYERFGEPVAVGMYPQDAKVNVDGTETDAGDFMKSVVRKLRNNSSLTVPSNRDEDGNLEWEIKFLESNMRGADFETYLKRLDMEKARAIFVPDLLFGSGKVGSYKLGDRHTNTFLTLLNSLIGDLKDHIDRYILPQLVEYNFANPVEATWSPELLGRSNVELLTTVAREMLRQGMATVDVRELSRRLGLTMEEVEQVVEDDDSKKKIKKDGPGSKKTAVKSKSQKEAEEAAKKGKKFKKQVKKNSIFQKYNGKELTERESSVEFGVIEEAYNKTEEELKSRIQIILDKQKNRIKETVSKSYDGGKGNPSEISIGYRGSYDKEWKAAILALYMAGAESEIKRADIKIKKTITKKEKGFLDKNAEIISKTQLDDLENKINQKILEINDLNVGKTAAIAMISSIFLIFEAKNSSLDKSIQRAVVWGVRQGKVAVAERSSKKIVGKVWSSVLDSHVCPLCESLDGMFMEAGTREFHSFIAPVHWNCRCEEMFVYDDDKMKEDEKEFKMPKKDVIKKYGGLLPPIK